MTSGLTNGLHATVRHRTASLEAGPSCGPLLIFIHGWPELGIFWRAQLAQFAANGLQCVAPDMRGYGGSSVPGAMSDYTVRELVGAMIELHDALGGEPAIWVGHDWGSAVAWAMASHQPERCRGVASLGVPYLARGLALPTLMPLIDRSLYPEDRFPVGQRDQWLSYRAHFAAAARTFEADSDATLAALDRRRSPDLIGKPALTASIRASGGWFGGTGRAPPTPSDGLLVSGEDFAHLADGFRATDSLARTPGT